MMNKKRFLALLIAFLLAFSYAGVVFATESSQEPVEVGEGSEEQASIESVNLGTAEVVLTDEHTMKNPYQNAIEITIDNPKTITATETFAWVTFARDNGGAERTFGCSFDKQTGKITGVAFIRPDDPEGVYTLKEVRIGDIHITPVQTYTYSVNKTEIKDKNNPVITEVYLTVNDVKCTTSTTVKTTDKVELHVVYTDESGLSSASITMESQSNYRNPQFNVSTPGKAVATIPVAEYSLGKWDFWFLTLKDLYGNSCQENLSNLLAITIEQGSSEGGGEGESTTTDISSITLSKTVLERPEAGASGDTFTCTLVLANNLTFSEDGSLHVVFQNKYNNAANHTIPKGVGVTSNPDNRTVVISMECSSEFYTGTYKLIKIYYQKKGSTERTELTFPAEPAISFEVKEAPHEHNLILTEAKAATCTEAGNNEYYTCNNCHNVYKNQAGTTSTSVSDETIPATGHSMSKTEAKAATCTEDGNIEYYTCSNCNVVFKDSNGNETINDVILAKLGHAGGWETVPATCTEDGTKTRNCTRCNEITVETLKAHGHMIQNGECILGDYTAPAPEPDKNLTVTVTDQTKIALETAFYTIFDGVDEGNVAETLGTKVDSETAENIAAALSDGATISVKTVANVISANEVSNTDSAILSSASNEKKVTIAQYMDLSQVILATDATNNPSVLGTLNETGNKIPVTITVPTNLRKGGRKFSVIRLHNGQADIVVDNVALDSDGQLVIESNLFSIYALAFKDPESANSSGSSSSSSNSDSGSSSSSSSGSSAGTAETKIETVKIAPVKTVASVKKAVKDKSEEVVDEPENQADEEADDVTETDMKDTEPEQKAVNTDSVIEVEKPVEKEGSLWWLYLLLCVAVVAAVGIVFIQKKKNELDD